MSASSTASKRTLVNDEADYAPSKGSSLFDVPPPNKARKSTLPSRDGHQLEDLMALTPLQLATEDREQLIEYILALQKLVNAKTSKNAGVAAVPKKMDPKVVESKAEASRAMMVKGIKAQMTWKVREPFSRHN
jgi:hypothetical protein